MTDLFHPAVACWFSHTFRAPTPAQADAWPAIKAGKHVLIAAPTGSGKTLAAFLAAIDELVREGEQWGLPDETRVVYVSPLKALSNDINKNLEAPLNGIREQLRGHTIRDVVIRTWVRTGDTPQYERAMVRRRPPHIVVTTPESLYILLGSESGRQMLSTVRSVIVDEIHAVAGTKRGSHLSLSLERLESLTGRRLTRIGLSATQKPIEEVARFLVGTRGIRADGTVDCTIVDSGHVRRRDLALELPDAPLEAVMSHEVWTQVYDRLAQLIREHRTTLVFVNTRRMAERVCRHLSERLDTEARAAATGLRARGSGLGQESDTEVESAFASAGSMESASVSGSDPSPQPHAPSPAPHDRRREHAPSVAAHHGSLAKDLRFDAEQRLKRGDLKALVATASLELGIDIGDVDLVCQIGSPRSINAFLQRVGRSGHAVGGTPKGRLFPLSRDELAECTALLDSVRRGELDRLGIPIAPIDVLSQHIVAEVATRDCTETELFELMRAAYPYRDLARGRFDEIVHMLAEGFTTRRGRHGALLYHDAVNRIVRGRKGARLTAITSGGAIPDTADYQVLLEPEGHLIGTVNEDFAVESLAGDVFQLGNSSYRIIRVERSIVRVEDARGEAPTIPFWLGEAPGRTDELSVAVSRLRDEIAARLETQATGNWQQAAGQTGSLAITSDTGNPVGVESAQRNDGSASNEAGEASFGQLPVASRQQPVEPSSTAVSWLTDELGVGESAASQLAEYYAAAHAALGCLPTRERIVFERFFDEAGGMQLVIHSPFGSRVNRAWGLALRKRFCRSFNFELQAAATEDTIILSLTTAHSFELAEVARYLHPNTARDLLIQALLDAPMFATRWRWAASIALALPRFRGGKKVPPQLARMNAEDLLAAVFPDQVACGENIVGDIVVPDHPLVQQTVQDCLTEAMDVAGFERVLEGLISGRIEVAARDLTEPSPLTLEVLSARPYAYLDDAPLEERRTQAVMSRRYLDPQTAADIGKLDPEAIARVREEAWPDASTPDELHDALLWLTHLGAHEAQRHAQWHALLRQLIAQHRVVVLRGDRQLATGTWPEDAAAPSLQGAEAGLALFVAVERWPLIQAVFPHAHADAHITLLSSRDKQWSREEAMVEIVRGRLEGLGPTTSSALAGTLGVETGAVDTALLALEAEGTAMRGSFEGEPGDAPLSAPMPFASPERRRELDFAAGQSPAASWPVGQRRDRAAGEPQWCDRRLLARIHRYTVKRLRAEIEPVQARDFLRFLFDWQRVATSARMQGPDSVPAMLAQLEGFEPAASAWETEILPARIAEYDPAWLDEQCQAGRIVWARLAARSGDSERGVSPVRSTPIALLARRNVKLWSSFRDTDGAISLTPKAEQAAEFIRAHGASFFDEIVEGSGLLPTQVEEALAELVALGLINSDSFGGLRALLVPSDRRRPTARDARRKRRMAIFGMRDAGRWALVRRRGDWRLATGSQQDPNSRTITSGQVPVADRQQPAVADAVEHVCRTLLRRWGVVFWKLLEREADWLPRWRDMLMCLRRLEARGEIRGGRFVAGFSGEQFALPEAIGPLRDARRKQNDSQLISLSGADPLNLVGIVTPGPRLPSLTGNRVLYRDGLPIAVLAGGEVRFLETIESDEEWALRNALLRRQVPPVLSELG